MTVAIRLAIIGRLNDDSPILVALLKLFSICRSYVMSLFRYVALSILTHVGR